MPAPTIFDGLRIATESLSDTIYRKASQTNFWTGWVDNDEFPRNRGTVQTTFTVGNSEPTTNSEDWTQVTQSGSPASIITDACARTYTDVNVGYTSKTYNPKRFGLAGPVVCRETLAFAHDPAMFLRQYQNELVKRAKRTWEFELRNQATLLSSKVVCDSTFAIQAPAASFDVTNAPTSQLSLPMLDVIAQYLIEIGATDADQDWVELGPDGPVFNLVIGNEAAARILTNTAEIRTDWRYAQMGLGPKADLLKRIGANRMVRNFRVVPTVLPPRYNYTAAVGATPAFYTQVPTYVMSSGVASINPNYQSALYEVAFVPHPMAFKKSIVRPDSAGLDWSPLNYMGEWKWITGPEMATTFNFDPMRNYGRHFAEFMYAPKPVFPEFGVAIMYLRCPTTYPALVACAAL